MEQLHMQKAIRQRHYGLSLMLKVITLKLEDMNMVMLLIVRDIIHKLMLMLHIVKVKKLK